jgi:hypothetical protein
VNYRKKYKEVCGKDIPEGYEVHHIDADRSNNSCDNLIALPRSFHKTLHSQVGLLPKDPLEKLLKLYEESNAKFTTYALANWIYVRLEKVGVSNDIIVRNKKEIGRKKLMGLGLYMSNGFN